MRVPRIGAITLLLLVLGGLESPRPIGGSSSSLGVAAAGSSARALAMVVDSVRSQVMVFDMGTDTIVGFVPLAGLGGLDCAMTPVVGFVSDSAERLSAVDLLTSPPQPAKMLPVP